MATEHSVESRVRRHLLALGIGSEPASVVVALSGGCDSVVLLHLLRFPLSSLGLTVSAAHLNHRMRPGSEEDAEWVRGLCAAWDVPLRQDALDVPPRSEDEARRARYTFLRECARDDGAELIATAHHADDQAETVLFRAVRGTGLKGLAGISALTDGLLRPLLPLWRRELEEYARARGLRWRVDATNAGLDPARNRIRNEVLPLIERNVAPAARRSLVALAELAGEAEGALERIAYAAEKDLVRWEEGVPSLARGPLALYDSAIASRVLRNLLRHFGVVLGRTGTRRALQFITHAHSGRQMPLSGTLRIDIEFDRALIRRVGTPVADRTLEIDSSGLQGEARVRIGGAEYLVRHGPSGAGGSDPTGQDPWIFLENPSRLAFPLRIRGWRDGDRMRRGARSRSLKKIFLEQRVPRDLRRRLPLLIDAGGEVVWVAGLPSSARRAVPEAAEYFVLQVLHD